MMENTEIIKTLRLCAKSGNVIDYCELGDNNDCLLWDNCGDCIDNLLRAAADALESKSKAVIPHRNYENCHIYWCDCGWFLRNKEQTPNYCPNCGKRIEWENAE